MEINTSSIIDNSQEVPSSEPRQKINDSKKTKSWGISNILWLENKLINSNSYSQISKIEMRRNADLYYRNILDRVEVAKIINPRNIEGFELPDDFIHYKIENPKIRVLLGEELKRKFEWKVYVCNRDAVSQKEEQKKEQYFQWVSEKIKSEAFDEKQAESELQKLQDYLTYDWAEIRELTADQLLHYYIQQLDLKTQFSRAWESGLIKGQEIMDVDEHNSKPHTEACDPQQLYWVSTVENPYIDDADEVIRVQYLPLGKVIDYWFDDLKPTEIDDLEEKTSQRAMLYDRSAFNQMYVKNNDGTFGPANQSTNNPMYLDGVPTIPTTYATNSFGEWWDSDGNIRVVTARWKSLRKIGKLKYYDDEGDQQIKDVDENYKIDISKGEEVEWKWISEAWEGTRIGEDTYVKIQPRNCQFRDIDSPASCSLGYIGMRIDNYVYQLMKNYSIKYDAYMWRTNEAMKKALGKIGVLDLSQIPDDWTIDMWMHYATNLGWVVKDSFKESKKGNSQGKLAGSMSGDANVMNLEQGQFIEQNMKMLQYIEQQLDLLIGINPQRQGQISPDAGLQVTREASAASSNVTESYFALHDNMKMRTLRALLEVAKYCMKNKNETIQYITSEMTTNIFNVDGEQFNEASYGILIGNATNDQRTIEILQEAVKIALQTGQVDLIQLMDIFSTDTTASIKRKVEKSVRVKQEQEQKNAEAENQHKEADRAQLLDFKKQEMEDKDLNRELEKYKIDSDHQNKIEVQELANYFQMGSEDADNDGIPDAAEIAANALAQQELQSDIFSRQQELLHDKDKHSKDHAHKQAELDLKIKELKQKQKESEDKIKIEKLKIEQTRVQNLSQEKMQKEQIKNDKILADKKLAIERIKAKKKTTSK